ncbi:MAG: D-Ala-D-Ala carboxypeptidase family metallohydrolase [Stappiaceae bacterium]|uniref:YcbK family protein n=1 Tax=Roseibium sp. TaxID=1936156 RepID=UPI0032996339
MADSKSENFPKDEISKFIHLHDSIELKKYETRWSFYKVLAGSTLVGIVAALLPFILDAVAAYRQGTLDHRGFIERYTDNALNQDIELRIRFSEYFSLMADDGTRQQWKDYHVGLLDARRKVRTKIIELETERAKIIAETNDEPSEKQQIRLAIISRELSWAVGEMGYAERNVSITQTDPKIESDPSANRFSPVSIEEDPTYVEDFIEFLSPHVKQIEPEEFLLTGAGSRPGHRCAGLNGLPPRQLWPNFIPVAQVLDEFRSRIGKPVSIVVAYRSTAYNACVGGARNSQHIQFRAVDFMVDGMNTREIANVLRQMRSSGLFSGGIGTYSSFVHVDTRGSNHDWQS